MLNQPLAHSHQMLFSPDGTRLEIEACGTAAAKGCHAHGLYTGCTASKDGDFLAIMLRSAFISAGASAGSRQSAAAQPAAARAPHPASGGAAALLGKHGGLQIFKG